MERLHRNVGAQPLYDEIAAWAAELHELAGVTNEEREQTEKALAGMKRDMEAREAQKDRQQRHK